MLIPPSSRIILLKTPFEMDERNQLTFSNKDSQFNYFYNLPKLEYDRCTYQRKEGVIRYLTDNSLTYEDLLEYNYCMYQNENYSDKWFYAYIDNIEYNNDGMSVVSITTDAFQTWQFDIEYKKSFIEREHVNDDTIGLHTIPEGLEHGPYINAKSSESFSYADNCYLVIGTTEMYDENVERPASVYNGIYGGLIYNVFKSTSSANAFISNLDEAGRGDIIDCLFMIPQSMALTTQTDEYSFTRGGSSFLFYLLKGSSSAYNFGSVAITRPTYVGTNYTPSNNKLFCYPYNSLIISNNVGTSGEYHYEEFSNINSISFNVYASITPGCSIKAIPNNYKGITSNIEESLNGAKLPICSWNTDVYTNWLTQNSVNNSIGILSSGINLITGALTGNVGGVINGALGIGSKMGEIYEHSFTPNQARGNTNSGDVVYSTGNSDFNIYYMTIKNEYAKIIDNYFSMFGYKVNDVKLPNITGRLNWNYVKTIDINITGDIPQSDLQTIKDMFNNGCTFWHNPTTFLDYSQSNTILV